MNQAITIAAGVLTGLAVIVSLGGFSNKKNSKKNDQFHRGGLSESNEIPDEILDGHLNDDLNDSAANKTAAGKRYQRQTEEGVKDVQQVLSKVSNALENLSVIVASVIKLFCADPYDRINTSVYIS